MSADMYLDCPYCGYKDTVRIDGLHDIDIYDNGLLETDVHGYCTYCQKEFKLNNKE
jgi:uncharacterized Zn-finger protein